MHFSFILQPMFGQAAPYGQYQNGGHNSNNGGNHGGGGGQLNHESNDWTNIIPTISDASPKRSHGHLKNSFTYTGNFVFYGLRPSTEYEVIIQSRNSDGWSDPNDIFKFSTRSRGTSIFFLFELKRT